MRISTPLFLAFFVVGIPFTSSAIDRQALVTRHNPIVENAEPFSPLTVGNGDFAFTVDITGMQTFPHFYRDGIPLGTQSTWGWHTLPSPQPYTLLDSTQFYDAYTRQVGYVSQTRNDAGQWLRANPHRLHLGKVGFQFQPAGEAPISIENIEHPRQSLDMWTGIITSTYTVNGKPVRVETCCHPEQDVIGVRVESPLLLEGALSITFEFPYGSDKWGEPMADFASPERHRSDIINQQPTHVTVERTLDRDRYYFHSAFPEQSSWEKTGAHRFSLLPPRTPSFSFSFGFAEPKPPSRLPSMHQTREASIQNWKHFWMDGGVVDLQGNADPRAGELERRIVLSQYLTAIQCASTAPPQESGLTHNSWHGKFHLEMHWWHTVHFALWNRLAMMEKSLPWYNKILPRAKETARQQGYLGARWPKMIGPDGRESPSGVGVFLIWQQPHPIYYAELCYRARPTAQTLETYKDIVFETANFMATYPHWDMETQRYILGPPLIPAQECYPPTTTYNPTFELAYWVYALERAQEWRKRLGYPPHAQWQHVIDYLSDLPTREGVYVTTEATPDTFENAELRRDHPSFVGALGFVPEGKMVDCETMRRTLYKIMEDWNWESTWGWDYPLLAMTAARLGEPELAIQSLLMDTPKNNYLVNGHCYQRKTLPTYLPANGGLLSAIAMMAAGWDGAPDINAPGFPRDWTVRWEGLQRMP
jgi:protein-glucosylgalactosylhydroxylysine glucosidase